MKLKKTTTVLALSFAALLASCNPGGGGGDEPKEEEGKVTETEWKNSFEYLSNNTESRNFTIKINAEEPGEEKATIDFVVNGFESLSIENGCKEFGYYDGTMENEGFLYEVYDEFNYEDPEHEWMLSDEIMIINFSEVYFLDLLKNKMNSFSFSNKKYTANNIETTFYEMPCTLDVEIQYNSSKKIEKLKEIFTIEIESTNESITTTYDMTFSKYGTSTIDDFPTAKRPTIDCLSLEPVTEEDAVCTINDSKTIPSDGEIVIPARESNKHYTTIIGNFSSTVTQKYLTAIYIPSTVSYIRSKAFTDCSNLSEIHYGGTKEQWQEIYKEEDWNHGCTKLKKVCLSDGTELTDEEITKSSYNLISLNLDESTYTGEIALSATSPTHFVLTVNYTSDKPYQYLALYKDSSSLGITDENIKQIIVDGVIISQSKYSIQGDNIKFTDVMNKAATIDLVFDKMAIAEGTVISAKAFK